MHLMEEVTISIKGHTCPIHEQCSLESSLLANESERGKSNLFPFQDGIVAHAFYPRDGRLHFDADEEWTLNQSNGVNLYQVS